MSDCRLVAPALLCAALMTLTLCFTNTTVYKLERKLVKFIVKTDELQGLEEKNEARIRRLEDDDVFAVQDVLFGAPGANASDATLVVVGGENGFQKVLGSTESRTLATGAKCDGATVWPSSYPELVEGARSGQLKGANVVCGGDLENATCYALRANADGDLEWSYFTNMTTGRSHHAIVSLPDRLWIMGGLGIDGQPLASTEYIYPDGSKESGPELPAPLAKMCAVQATAYQILVIGGRGVKTAALASTWIFDVGTKTWTEGPELATARLSHGCAKFNSEYHEKDMIVAMGGLNNDMNCVGINQRYCSKSRDTVEIIDSRNLTAWGAGASIPPPKKDSDKGLFGMGVVQTATSVIVTGGFDKPHLKLNPSFYPWVYFYNLYRARKTVQELKCEKEVGCHWTKLPYSLTHKRGHHVAFLVSGPDKQCLL